MTILLAITYTIVATWISGGVFYWIFRRGKWYPTSVYRRVESFFGTLGCLSILLCLSWLVAWHLQQVTSSAERQRECNKNRQIERNSFLTTYTNVFELLRERNRRELELRLDYDLRAAKMIEAIHSNSFSVVSSDLTNLPSSFLDLALIMKLRNDIGLIKRELKSEVDFPSESFELLDGGTGQFQTDDSP